MDWHAFLEGGESLTALEIFLRVTILYFTILIMTRIIGHRQVGIVSAFNFIIHAGMAHVATSRMVNPQSSLMVAILVIIISYTLTLLLSWIDYKFPSLVGNEPIHLMENGSLLRKNLKRTHVTIEDLLGQLRIKNATTISQVSEVVLEPMGEISVMKKAKSNPITRGKLNLPSKATGMSILLIYEGKILNKNLLAMGLEKGWLEKEILKKGFYIRDVMVATIEPSGNIFVSVI